MMKLSTNMRLQQTSDPVENLKQKQFSEFLLEIGNGTYTVNSDTEDIISLPLNIVLFKGTLINLIDFVFFRLTDNYGHTNYMIRKAILTTKKVNVDSISDIIMEKIPSEINLYVSADSID